MKWQMTVTVMESLTIWDLKKLAVNSAAITRENVRIAFLYTAKIVPSIKESEENEKDTDTV
jgi:hypothetical protein